MRGVIWLEALRGSRQASRWAAPGVLAVAAALFTGVFLLRLAVDDEGAAILVLLCLPVALLAVSFGRVAGSAAAALALALAAAYAAGSGSVGGAPGLLSRGTAYVLLGFLPGWFADRLAAATRREVCARSALQQARDELQQAQRVAGVGSWSWDAATDRLSLSPQLVEMLELDPSTPLQIDEVVTSRLHPDDVASALGARDQLLREAGRSEDRLRLLLPGGHVRHVVNRAEAITEGDTVVGMRGTTLDITALHEAEAIAEAARERLSQVLETLVDGITVGRAVRDAHGAVVDFTVEYLNTAAAALLGRPAQEMVGRRWSELWPERMHSDVFTAYVRMVETGEPLELAALPAQQAGVPDSAAEVVDLRAARLGDGCVTAVRDVSQRVLAERRLNQAAERFTAAFDRAPVGMALIRPDGVVFRANDALGGIAGRSVKELIGLRFDALVEERDVEACREQLRSLVAAGAGSTSRAELRLRTTDGGWRWVMRSISIVEDDTSCYAVAHVEDIHERKRYEGRMRYLADHDALTGLYNRRRFHEELAHHCALERRYGGGGAVVLVDLDNFKYINDTLGHRTGDELIQAIARVLRSRLRDSDVLGRLGGDELAVLLPGADELHAVEVAGSLLAAIRGTEVSEAGQRVRSTGSAGVALLDEPSAQGADDVLANADLAMYAAKDAGRDTLVVYDPQGPHVARSRARFRWLDRIRHALDADLLELQAQPIQDLRTGQVAACELLVRMREGDHLVQPGRFLYIAERHGLAVAIDHAVIIKAVDLAAGQDRPPGFRWEINLSGDSLGDPALPLLIESRLRETGVPPSALVFEITETAAISNMDEARVFAARIRDLGCSFALDDFGAGYGSFYYLKHLPFDYLKIDGEFVRQLATSEVDRVIVRSIVASAHPLGKQTIAEYVQDAETLQLLRELGVDHAQGYHVGRPVEPTLPLSLPV